MDKGQKQWDKLINMPQEYEQDPSIAQRAIEEIYASQQQPKKSWFARKWKVLAGACAAVVLALGVGIPLYAKLSTPQIVYYEKSDIIYASVENPIAFVEENKLDILYFDDAVMINTQSAVIIKTEEFAFLEQETLHMSDSGFFDKVILRSVVKKNAEFNFYDEYKNLNETQIIQQNSIRYKIVEKENTGDKRIFARFTYQNAEYFLDIITEQDGVQQLETYVNMLLA